jgi:flavin-binding protein dodecin
MPNHVYKSIELTGSSTTTIEDAVGNAIARAAKTLRDLRWFQIVETRGEIRGDRVAHWQVTLKVGFTLDDAETARTGPERSSRVRLLGGLEQRRQTLAAADAHRHDPVALALVLELAEQQARHA